MYRKNKKADKILFKYIFFIKGLDLSFHQVLLFYEEVVRIFKPEKEDKA